MTVHQRRIFGYTDLGVAFVPPRPGSVGLTDRADGTVYFVSFSGDFITLQTLPSKWGDHTYEAGAGPFVQTPIGPIRLLVRDGRLGYEVVASADHKRVRNAKVYTVPIRGPAPTVYEVRQPAVFTGTEGLAYELQ